jgi:hypothetical protein
MRAKEFVTAQIMRFTPSTVDSKDIRALKIVNKKSVIS